jgi:molecular chaperone DnaK
MYSLRKSVPLLLIPALLIAGCDATSLVQPTPVTLPGASAPAAEAPITAATAAAPPTAEVSTAAAAPTAEGPSSTPAPNDTVQIEQVQIDSAGELAPATITTTVGVTIELLLLNRGHDDALLLFELAPAGALGVPVPAATLTDTTPLSDTPPLAPTAIAADTATPARTAAASVTSSATSAAATGAAEPTAPLILVPTFSATLVPTRTATTGPTSLAATPAPTEAPAAIVPTGTPTITSPADLAGTTIWLRYDQPGTYSVRCVPSATDEPAGCTGEVRIVVLPGVTPLVTPTPSEPTGTPSLTGTSTLTGTATLTDTATLAETAMAASSTAASADESATSAASPTSEETDTPTAADTPTTPASAPSTPRSNLPPLPITAPPSGAAQ